MKIPAALQLAIFITPGVDPGIPEAMDWRVKPGNDGWGAQLRRWDAGR